MFAYHPILTGGEIPSASDSSLIRGILTTTFIPTHSLSLRSRPPEKAVDGEEPNVAESTAAGVEYLVEICDLVCQFLLCLMQDKENDKHGRFGRRFKTGHVV
jgi:hypothetical protein